MIYIKKVGENFEVFTEIPSVNPQRPNIGYYHMQLPSVHLEDGYLKYAPLPIPAGKVRDTYKRVGDTYTDIFRNKTTEEISDENNAPLISEYKLYLKRQRDGIEAYMMISAEFRLLKLNGVLTEAAHGLIEAILTPVRNEVIAGQWKKGLEILVSIGSSDIGLALYDRLHAQLTEYITNNY